ncbi:MAG: nicotinamide riboside transporter PnuC [Verrucomicrobiota bacterium]
MAAVTVVMVTLSWRGWWPVSLTEAWGFSTGGVCVWLVVREHMANWPAGLANNVVFFALFHQSRLFADMWLQAVYFALGIFGWWNWHRGGDDRSALRISRTQPWEWALLLCFVPVGTWGFRYLLTAHGGAAPFWDSLTTVLSLAAQYLLCRKRLENWIIWILADLIYVPLYFSRSLPLTAVLYGVFLIMCLIGLREWRRKSRSGGGAG